MRRIFAVAALALSTFGVAIAAQDEATSGRAYLGFSFGGHEVSPRDFHYGLRLDYDTRYSASELGRPSAPMMQFDFTRAGLAGANVNGLSILKKSYTLKQNNASEVPAETSGEAEAAPAEAAPAETAPAETAAAAAPAEAAPAEQPGFFARSWRGVKNFFSFGSSDATETAGADKPAETPAENPADVATGMFMGYNAIDWTTLAVGVVGLGAIVSEVSNGDESATVSSPSPPPPGTPCTVPGVPIPQGCVGLVGPLTDNRLSAIEDPEHQKWLDEGTGHMGDLGN